MNNILNHNRNLFDFDICERDYWDFHLSMGDTFVENNIDCLSAYIDISDDECVWFDEIHSSEKYIWGNAVNKGIALKNIGYTGVDNGFIYYEKDRITNKEFLDLFTNSTYYIEENDKRLRLYKVRGNNGLYDYTSEITDNDNCQALMLNGGFYQGFFKTSDCTYQTLPSELGNGWSFDFVLKKKDFINEKRTLNDVYPENKGMFFYIGTRSENKWWRYYDTDINRCSSEEELPFEDGYFTNSDNLNSNYLTAMEESYYATNDYVDEGYLTNIDDYTNNIDGYIKYDEYNDNALKYVDDEYIEKEVEINPVEDMTTNDGYSLQTPNIVEFKTDNKFLLFNQTKNGFTVDNWDENAEIRLHMKKPYITENYFTLFNQTKNGVTIDNMKQKLSDSSRHYDVLKDLYRNAIGFQITDNGKIGYKYLVKDCENNDVKIETEFSVKGIISDDRWHDIVIVIQPVSKNKMRIIIYVDGKLKLCSRELPTFNFRKLEELDSKQEAVPFNISIGGGTQGLCDSVYLDYRTVPDTVLPLEKNFAGTFIGYIKSFAFHDCALTLSKIKRHLKTVRQLSYCQ